MATPLPDTNSMRGVSAFIAQHGWQMSTGNVFLIAREQLRPIDGLPWRGLTKKRFQAVTHDGILYVPLRGFGPESFGVAYNPDTNQFTGTINGFQPIGSHWYAWKHTMGQHKPEEKEYE